MPPRYDIKYVEEDASNTRSAGALRAKRRKIQEKNRAHALVAEARECVGGCTGATWKRLARAIPIPVEIGDDDDDAWGKQAFSRNGTCALLC